MNAKALRFMIGVLVVAALNGTPVEGASAQVSIGVSPSVINFTAEPGASGEQTLDISNNGDTQVDATVEIGSFPDLPGKYSAVDWLKLDTTEVELKPESVTTVSLGVQIPDDATTGGAYAQILITTGGPDDTGGVQVKGQLSVVVIFEVDAGGEPNRELNIERFAPTLEPDGRVGFRGEVTNAGNTQALVYGEMQVTPAGGDGPGGSLQVGTTRVLPTVTGTVSSQGTLPLPANSEWTAETTIFPDNPDEVDDLKPVTITTDFTVSPQLEVAASICENLDRGPTVTLTTDNSGTIGLVPNVVVALTTADGDSIASIVPQGSSVAWPGASTSTPIEGLPQLTGGDYLLTTTATIVQGLDPIVTEVPFSIGGFGDNVAPLCGSEPATTLESTPSD